MSTSLFFDWIKNHFIPEVKGILIQLNRPLKALLILDKAPSHSKTDEINFDPNFKVLSLTPNCMAILQFMDRILFSYLQKTVTALC